MDRSNELLESVKLLAKQMIGIIEDEEENLENENIKVELSTLKKGDIFETDKRKYVVLEQYPFTEQTKIMSLDFILKNEKFDYNGNDYKKSKLRKKCDTAILKDFESEFGVENLVEHNVDLTTVDNQKCFGTVRCKVRPLTFDEARQYNDILVRPDLPDWYYTCTAWSTDNRGWPRSIAIVFQSGYIGSSSCDFGYGVRPVCILKDNVFVSKVKNN